MGSQTHSIHGRTAWDEWTHRPTDSQDLWEDHSGQMDSRTHSIWGCLHRSSQSAFQPGGGRKDSWAPTPSSEVIDSWWLLGEFSLGVWSLTGWTCSSGWLHIRGPFFPSCSFQGSVDANRVKLDFLACLSKVLLFSWVWTLELFYFYFLASLMIHKNKYFCYFLLPVKLLRRS